MSPLDPNSNTELKAPIHSGKDSQNEYNNISGAVDALMLMGVEIPRINNKKRPFETISSHETLKQAAKRARTTLTLTFSHEVSRRKTLAEFVIKKNHGEVELEEFYSKMNNLRGHISNESNKP